MIRQRKSRSMQEQIKYLRKQGYSIRAIANALQVHRRTVRRYLPSDDKHKLIVSLPDEATIGKDLNWDHIHHEYAKGVPLKIIHQEVLPEVDYVKFWRAYRKEKPQTPQVTMILDHRPGERTQIDYCDGIPIYNRKTGEKTETQFFCGVLAFSSYTYGEFTLSQKIGSFIDSQKRMWRYFGGVTPYVVIDNLKSGVSKPHLYDPDVNPTYCEFANHTGFAVLPARPYKPKDKAAVESAIGVIQENFFALVRNRKFYSLAELNRAFWQFLKTFNDHVMKDYGISRYARFQSERSLLNSLPQNEFEIAEWKSAKVHPDCHIQLYHNLYSVPYRHVGQTVRARLTSKIVEIFDNEGEAIAAHPLLVGQYQRHTIDQHYPEDKVSVAYYEIKHAKKEAAQIGENTLKLCTHLFDKRQPLRFLRRIQGVLRLVKSDRVSKEALEYASSMALKFNKPRMDYIRGCAIYFDKNGIQPILSTPIRDESSVHLHNNPNKERNQL